MLEGGSYESSMVREARAGARSVDGRGDARSLPGEGEVRIRIAASGVNPGDIKKREDMFGYGMAYPRVIPHSDGAGRGIDKT